MVFDESHKDTEEPPTDDVVYGDANCDKNVNLADAVLIMQSLANPDKFGENGSDATHITPQGSNNADCCNVGDGITNKDALAIQKKLLDLISALPETDKAIPHKACAEDALSDFSSDCIEIPQAY